MLIHTFTLLFVSKIGYMLFKRKVLIAQLLTFVLLSNDQTRKFNMALFNDSILSFYIVLCFFFTLSNKPILAAAFLTLAISIKAGALLLLPSFLGWVQY
jgi:uncharacterized membrane protein